MNFEIFIMVSLWLLVVHPRPDDQSHVSSTEKGSQTCPLYIFMFLQHFNNIGKTSFCPKSFRFVKFSFPVTRLMAYYAQTGHSRLLIA
jgi:hypothetical protein